jgi:hypothetical protein
MCVLWKAGEPLWKDAGEPPAPLWCWCWCPNPFVEGREEETFMALELLELEWEDEMEAAEAESGERTSLSVGVLLRLSYAGPEGSLGSLPLRCGQHKK